MYLSSCYKTPILRYSNAAKGLRRPMGDREVWLSVIIHIVNDHHTARHVDAFCAANTRGQSTGILRGQSDNFLQNQLQKFQIETNTRCLNLTNQLN